MENTIIQYNPDFYSDNYKRIFIESDSRKGGILGHLQFLHGLNPAFAATIRQSLEKKYLAESTTYSLSLDSKKEFTIGDATITMDVSDYVGYLIKDNPSILTDTPILNVGYHKDGSQKSIDELLEAFESLTFSTDSPSADSDFSNVYSVYDGLISKALANSPIVDARLQERVHYFRSQAPCNASMKAVQAISEEVSPEKVTELFDRVLSSFSPFQDKEVDPNANYTR